MRTLPSLADARETLACVFPLAFTTWLSRCMDCSTTYALRVRPFEPELGLETTTTGLCDDCANARGAFDA